MTNAPLAAANVQKMVRQHWFAQVMNGPLPLLVRKAVYAVYVLIPVVPATQVPPVQPVAVNVQMITARRSFVSTASGQSVKDAPMDVSMVCARITLAATVVTAETAAMVVTAVTAAMVETAAMAAMAEQQIPMQLKVQAVIQTPLWKPAMAAKSFIANRSVRLNIRSSMAALIALIMLNTAHSVLLS